jgi:uncharacterized membrane protein YeiB
VARALAIFGMIIVNFKMAFGTKGGAIASYFAKMLEGKSAATFVVIAGVGIALLSNTAIKENNFKSIKNIQLKIKKRALLLFIIGLSYMPIWPADILHFYSIYMLITLLFLKGDNDVILIGAILVTFIYPVLVTIWNYDTYLYADFWSISGFFRNLFFNGFHPVIPWVSFMLVGLWFGRQNLNNHTFIKKTIWLSLGVFISIEMLSYTLLNYIDYFQVRNVELQYLLGTSPMPPLPLYMISGSSIAIFTISLCIYIANRYKDSKVINALKSTGQLALTFYIAHVIIGMGIVELINPQKMGNYTIEFSVIYAILFSGLCIVFTLFWTRYYKVGALEWMLKRLTD